MKTTINLLKSYNLRSGEIATLRAEDIQGQSIHIKNKAGRSRFIQVSPADSKIVADIIKNLNQNDRIVSLSIDQIRQISPVNYRQRYAQDHYSDQINLRPEAEVLSEIARDLGIKSAHIKYYLS